LEKEVIEIWKKAREGIMIYNRPQISLEDRERARDLLFEAAQDMEDVYPFCCAGKKQKI